MKKEKLPTVISGEINIISDLCLLVGHSYKLLYYFLAEGYLVWVYMKILKLIC